MFQKIKYIIGKVRTWYETLTPSTAQVFWNEVVINNGVLFIIVKSLL